MTAVDGLKDYYLTILSIYTSKYINFYDKAIVGLPESDRYDLTRSKWTDFYQELENAIFKFGFKAEVLMVTYIYGLHELTEVKDTMLYYPSITQVMVDSHCESLWDDNSGVGLGINPT